MKEKNNTGAGRTSLVGKFKNLRSEFQKAVLCFGLRSEFQKAVLCFGFGAVAIAIDQLAPAAEVLSGPLTIVGAVTIALGLRFAYFGAKARNDVRLKPPSEERTHPPGVIASKHNEGKELEIGDKMKDGTIFAGVSPDTGENMFVTPQDAPAPSDAPSECYHGAMRWRNAMAYAAELDTHGHSDWKLPTKAELEVLYKNRHKGALKHTFNEIGYAYDATWYWSRTRPAGSEPDAAAKNFKHGTKEWRWWLHHASLRPVRSEPRP